MSRQQEAAYLRGFDRERRKDEIARGGQAVSDFVKAALAGEFDRMLQLVWADIDLHGDLFWNGVMRELSKPGVSVPDPTRHAFLVIYIEWGEAIRTWVDDLALIRGLRALLPPYTGPAVHLYRGQNALPARARSYGLSWSASREVAETYAARTFWRHSPGGSVLLKTLAQPEAIICRVDDSKDLYGEAEYLVDRRHLHRVTKLARFAEETGKQHVAQSPETT